MITVLNFSEKVSERKSRIGRKRAKLEDSCILKQPLHTNNEKNQNWFTRFNLRDCFISLFHVDFQELLAGPNSQIHSKKYAAFESFGPEVIDQC